MFAFCVFAIFTLIVLLGWAAICRKVLAEEITRQFCRWENTWNHPEHRPWPGDPYSKWGPRFSWLCNLSDWLTRGRCHD